MTPPRSAPATVDNPAVAAAPVAVSAQPASQHEPAKKVPVTKISRKPAPLKISTDEGSDDAAGESEPGPDDLADPTLDDPALDTAALEAELAGQEGRSAATPDAPQLDQSIVAAADPALAVAAGVVGVASPD